VNVPDPAIVFENKEILYKKEKDRRVLFLPGRIAAAALAAGVIGLLIFNSVRKGPPERSLSSASGNKVEPGKPETLPAGKDAPGKDKDLLVKNIPGNKDAAIGKAQQPNNATAQQPNNRTAQQPDNRTPVAKKNERTVTSGPSAALHLSEAGQADRTAIKWTIHPTPARIVTTGIDGPAGKTLVLENTTFATQALRTSSNGDPEDSYAMESASLKKNKLRGLFRKVTRVLEKNTNRDEDDQRSVQIGSFQFALK
jgi:hypothetical protein